MLVLHTSPRMGTPHLTPCYGAPSEFFPCTAGFFVAGVVFEVVVGRYWGWCCPIPITATLAVTSLLPVTAFPIMVRDTDYRSPIASFLACGVAKSLIASNAFSIFIPCGALVPHSAFAGANCNDW